MSDIWGIILAAGESKRMKTAKMLLPYNGKTIIEQVIKNVTVSKVDRTMIILGAKSNEMLKVIEEYPVIHCYNDNYEQGMLSSVKCGFRYLPSDFEAALVLLGDQPMIPAEVINKVIDAYKHSDKGIIIPVYNNKRGHPLLIGHKYRDEIENLDAQIGLRSLAQRFPGDVLEVNMDIPNILKDIDSMEDYQDEINQIQ